MARRRGWGGDPPASDEEATRRIVAAAIELLATTGSPISIADIADSLGIIRQTVYRYFPTADALMRAAAIASADEFLENLVGHLRGIHDPAEAMTEGVLYTLDAVQRTPHLGILLSEPYSIVHSNSLASAQAQELGMQIIIRFDVDWHDYGYDDAALRGLVEFTLRTMLSFFIAPNDPARTPDELRRFLQRWLGGAVLAQRPHGGHRLT